MVKLRKIKCVNTAWPNLEKKFLRLFRKKKVGERVIGDGLLKVKIINNYKLLILFTLINILL